MKNIQQLGISPAPWKAYPCGVIEVNDGKDTTMIAVMTGHRQVKADARLIAAAPNCLMSLAETLAALKNRLPSQPTVTELEIIDRAERAIRKATGESEKGETK